MTALLFSPIARNAVLALALLAGVWFYGERRHAAGVRETTTEFLQADKEGANDVRDTARQVLSGIGDGTDPDELLRQTGGLRDD